MQVKKEDIKERILDSARSEFLEHGYSAASLRVIAQKAGLTKGAVYSYFKNKDALFCELTSPATSFIECEFQPNKCDYLFQREVNSYEITVDCFRRCAYKVLNNYESFKLLLFCSAGSSLQNYKESIIQVYAQNFYRLLMFITNTDSCASVRINEMFIHTLATTYVSFLEEIVLHEPKRKEVDDYVEQIAIFIHYGLKKLYLHKIKQI